MNRSHKHLWLSVCFVAAAAAQTPPAPLPAFEVASVKSIKPSTTVWLWIDWVQHLLRCPIQPGGG